MYLRENEMRATQIFQNKLKANKSLGKIMRKFRGLLTQITAFSTMRSMLGLE